MIPPTQAQGPDITAQPALDIPDDASVDLSGVLQESQIMEVLQKLDQELVSGPRRALVARHPTLDHLRCHVLDRQRPGVGRRAAVWRPPVGPDLEPARNQPRTQPL